MHRYGCNLAREGSVHICSHRVGCGDDHFLQMFSHLPNPHIVGPTTSHRPNKNAFWRKPQHFCIEYFHNFTLNHYVVHCFLCLSSMHSNRVSQIIWNGSVENTFFTSFKSFAVDVQDYWWLYGRISVSMTNWFQVPTFNEGGKRWIWVWGEYNFRPETEYGFNFISGVPPTFHLASGAHLSSGALIIPRIDFVQSFIVHSSHWNGERMQTQREQKHPKERIGDDSPEWSQIGLKVWDKVASWVLLSLVRKNTKKHPL